MQAFRIYFGRGRADGQTVSDSQLRRFLDSIVRPRFDAFTIQRGRGYWRNNSEPSIVLEIIYPDRNARHAVRQIAAEYKRRFGQEAVLVVGTDVESSVV